MMKGEGATHMTGAGGGGEPGRGNVSLAAAPEGLRFVFRAPLIRSTMLMDFFATFFSSATALLPIFAQTCCTSAPGAMAGSTRPPRQAR